MRLNLAKHLGFVALAAGLAACSATDLPSDPGPVVTTPSAGWLTVQLTSPRADDGAVQLHITGPALDSVQVAGFEGFGTVTSGAADLIVTGAIVSGTVARVHVADPSRVAEYRATVVAAAARATYRTQDIASYRASLTR